MINLKHGVLLLLLLAPRAVYSNDDNQCTEALVATGVVCFSLGMSIAGMLFYCLEQRRINTEIRRLNAGFTHFAQHYGPPPAYSLEQPRPGDHVAIDMPTGTPADPSTVAAAAALMDAHRRPSGSLTQPARAFGNLRSTLPGSTIPADE